MNRHRTRNQHSVKISYSLIIFAVFVLVGIAFLIPERENTIPNIAQARTLVPTATSIPVPETIEEIKADCMKGECLDACLAHANSQLQMSRLHSYEYLGDEVMLVRYGISHSDQLEKPRKTDVSSELLSYQQNEAAHKAIWDYYKTLIPYKNRPNLVSFGIFIDSATAGYFDTTATENWITNINILNLEDAYALSNVTIHEYGHYLTLNTTQMISWPESKTCRQEPLYGCQKPDSYINLFYLQFWADIYPEWEKIDWQSMDYEKEIGLFYQKYEDQFLNDYAATDPIEDIAESWAAFVLEPSPSGHSVAEQKIRFFYDFPELVQLRYQIIQGICTFKITQ